MSALACREVIEIEFYPCAACRTAVETRWTESGMLRGDNVLVADWVYHPSCWETMIRENPPDQQSAQTKEG